MATRIVVTPKSASNVSGVEPVSYDLDDDVTTVGQLGDALVHVDIHRGGDGAPTPLDQHTIEDERAEGSVAFNWDYRAVGTDDIVTAIAAARRSAADMGVNLVDGGTPGVVPGWLPSGCGVTGPCCRR